jgi:hypothetical protein
MTLTQRGVGLKGPFVTAVPDMLEMLAKLADVLRRVKCAPSGSFPRDFSDMPLSCTGTDGSSL